MTPTLLGRCPGRCPSGLGERDLCLPWSDEGQVFLADYPAPEPRGVGLPRSQTRPLRKGKGTVGGGVEALTGTDTVEPRKHGPLPSFLEFIQPTSVHSVARARRKSKHTGVISGAVGDVGVKTCTSLTEAVESTDRPLNKRQSGSCLQTWNDPQ